MAGNSQLSWVHLGTSIGKFWKWWSFPEKPRLIQWIGLIKGKFTGKRHI
jgi:hypothetical protein